MKKEKKIMSIGTQFIWGYIVTGMLWIGVGITDMFDGSVAKIIHRVFLAGTLVVLAILMLAKREKQDEMVEYNYVFAKAITRDMMRFVYCGAVILSAAVFGIIYYKCANVYWPKIICGIFFVLMGIQDLITGIMFRQLEAE